MAIILSSDALEFPLGTGGRTDISKDVPHKKSSTPVGSVQPTGFPTCIGDSCVLLWSVVIII